MIYLIDASVFVFRAWFSIPDRMADLEGRPVNAVYGFASFLGEFLIRTQPALVAVAFDESLTSSYRNEIYPEYKANREPAPPELKRQFKLCREVTDLLGLAHFADERFEADDIIGTIGARMQARGRNCVIVTRDKDLAQLLRQGDEFWDYPADRRYRYVDIAGQFGAAPESMADYQALVGDKVDNIPGVPGIGAKTAAALMREFDSLEAIFANLDAVEQMPIRGASSVAARLREHRDAAYLARRLTRIETEMPLDLAEASLSPSVPNLDALLALYDRLGFGARLRQQARELARRA